MSLNANQEWKIYRAIKDARNLARDSMEKSDPQCPEQWREDIGDPGVHDKDPSDLNVDVSDQIP